jgi:hypothetical protein
MLSALFVYLQGYFDATVIGSTKRDPTQSHTEMTIRSGRRVAPSDVSTEGQVADVRATRLLDAAFRNRQWGALAIIALSMLTIFGAIIRAKGFVTTGLFRDDAWEVLSSKVGLGTAWHMWATDPGYGLIERTWVVLGPNATWWYQIPDFVCSVAAIPASYILARYFRMGRCAALAVAVVVCTSPISVEYSTRIKEYPVDFLLSCLLLALAEAARRRLERGPLFALAMASAGAFFVSASVGIVIVGLWAALIVACLRDKSALQQVVVAGAVAAAACGIFAAVFYSHLSPYLNKFWAQYFIKHTSLSAFASSSARTGKRLLAQYLFGLPSHSSFGILLVVVCAGLALVALIHDPAMLGPAFAVLAAFAASAAHLAPLGTGRTDEYLYPPLLILLAVGAIHVLNHASAALIRLSASKVRTVALALLGIVTVVAAAASIQNAAREKFTYPNADIPALAIQLHDAERPGDHVFVNEITRYPWAFYEDTSIRIDFGSNWSAGFTAVSTHPKVFIAPSEDYEGGARPERWVEGMTPFSRVWYVWTTPRSSYAKTYGVFLRNGWHPVRTLRAPGCGATLLVRTTTVG